MVWSDILDMGNQVIEVEFDLGSSDGREGNLGSAGPFTTRVSGSDIELPLALNKAINQVDVTNDVPDIGGSLDNGEPWYFPTDGNAPEDTVDLMTVVLHEIAHGLGYACLPPAVASGY